METDRVCVLECNIDDMTPEELGYALERLLGAGALDVWHTPIYMKKCRPATLLSVLCRPEDRERLSLLVLRETSTLGVRWRELERRVADREAVSVATAWGLVRCKVKRLAGDEIAVKPEFEDCARLAREQGLALRQVYEDAVRAYRTLRQRTE